MIKQWKGTALWILKSKFICVCEFSNKCHWIGFRFAALCLSLVSPFARAAIWRREPLGEKTVGVWHLSCRFSSESLRSWREFETFSTGGGARWANQRFIHSFRHSFLPSFILLLYFFHSFILLFFHSFIHSFIPFHSLLFHSLPFPPSFIHSFIPFHSIPFPPSFIHSIPFHSIPFHFISFHSIIHSFFSFIHSFIHSFSQFIFFFFISFIPSIRSFFQSFSLFFMHSFSHCIFPLLQVSSLLSSSKTIPITLSLAIVTSYIRNFHPRTCRALSGMNWYVSMAALYSSIHSIFIWCVNDSMVLSAAGQLAQPLVPALHLVQKMHPWCIYSGV